MSGPDQLHPVLDALAAGDSVIARRLLVLRSVDVAVRGSEDACLSLDAAGAAVLVVMCSELGPGVGADIADELDRIAHIAMWDLDAPAGDASTQPRDLVSAHAAFFNLADANIPSLNQAQQVVVVVREQPGLKAWKDLIVELGDQLAAVVMHTDDHLHALEVPGELQRRRRTSPTGRSTPRAVGLVLLGVALGIVAVLAWQSRGPGQTTPSVSMATGRGSAVHDVVTGVPGGATHNQWIGQDHLVRTSDGTVVVVYGSPNGLQVVQDNANGGRSWQAPTTLANVQASSSSLAIDATDRIHVAFSDGSHVGYAMLERAGGRWTAARVVELDATAPTAYVDVAWDAARSLAHVVWVEDTPGAGQAPRWAAISTDPSDAVPLATGRLAPPGTDIPVLVNIEAGANAEVVATYRRGDAAAGWFARPLAPPVRDTEARPQWGPEEQVPTEAGIGAADVAIDGNAVTHLVLRDSTTFELTYFTRTPQGQWDDGETAVDATETPEIDFPTLTLDRSSRLVYLFFQNDRAQPHTAVRMAVRDPVDGWQTSVPVASDDAIPDDAMYPASPREGTGAPVVVWTTGGATSTLQAAVVVP